MSSVAEAMGRPSAGPRRQAPPVRLTDRGRAVVAVTYALLAVVLAFLVRQPPGLAGEAAPAAETFSYVVVQPGQTLWQIAEAAAPDVDPRVTIMRIQDLNGLSGAGVTPGQRIALPPSD